MTKDWKTWLLELMAFERETYAETHTRPRVEVTVHSNLLDIIHQASREIIPNSQLALTADGVRVLYVGVDISIKECGR